MSASDNKSSSPSPAHIMQTGFAFWSSKVLLTAVELDVFTALAKGPADLEALTQRLGLHPRSARDFFDTLVALGFLNRKDGQYSNTTDTEAFLDRNKPTVYIGGILQMLNNRLYHCWGNLTTALKTGLPQNEVKDKETDEMFATLYSDFDKAKEFLSAMTGASKAANIAIANTNSITFDWSKYKTYVDVGTAQGDLAVQVAVAHPHLTGLGLDLPAVQPHFDAYVAENKVQDRLKFCAGDFFKDDFPKCDVVMMGHILHDWDLPTKKMLIKKAHEALPAGGAFIVFESLIDDDRSKNAFGLLMSLNMLIETPGGFDYSGADCTAWLKEAGFSTVSVHHLVGPDSMVVALK